VDLIDGLDAGKSRTSAAKGTTI